MLSLKEELALIRTYIWHTKREESRLRRKLSSIESKIEQSRNQLRDVLKFMKQHQNGIDVHLKKLSKTENTLREQIDNIFPTNILNSKQQLIDNNNNNNNNNNKSGKLKQTKRAKKLNNDLIEIVQHRNDHESRLDSSQSTFKLISSLLNDETKPMSHHNIDNNNNNNNNNNDILYDLDDNISPSVSEYIYYRQEIAKIQCDLVECVEKRELANQAQYATKIALNKQIPNKCIKCQCQCKHRDEILINNNNNNNNNNIIISDDESDDESDDDIDDNIKQRMSGEILKSELIQLGQDIHQRSGLIRQQRRDGICHLRVFVGSELITWMVKSCIVKTRYEAIILSSLLIDGGYVYEAYSKPINHNNQYIKRIKINYNKQIKILNKSPSINLIKPPSSSSSLLSLPTTPNKLLLGSSSNVLLNNIDNIDAPSSNNNNNNNNPSSSAPSSVISIASSLSAISAISGTSCSSFSHRSSSSSSCSIQQQHEEEEELNIECRCLCSYCSESNKLNKSINLSSFHDTNDLYRFRCDDSRIERISKMGWLEKFGRFRSKKRHYIWDGVRRQLREYKTKGDMVPLYKYPFNKYTQINASSNDQCVLSITFFEIKPQSTQNHILKLKATTSRERDSWIRVLKNDNNNNYNNNYNIDNNTSNIDDDNISNIDDDNNNPLNLLNINNNNYEEYRYLRMTNRLKWSSLFISVKATSCFIRSFREFITLQNQLQRCHKTEIEGELSKLFTNRDSPISILFNSFSRLFLEPFYKININGLELESIDSIISLCVDDLSSFLQLSQSRLINLLLPASLRISNNNKPRPVTKLLNKLIKKCIYSHCFCSSIYNTIFPLYQRIHHDIDQKLYDISLNSQHFATKNYQISKELQIDKEWVKIKNNPIQKIIKYKNHNIDDNVDSILKIDSSKFKKAKNNITKLLTTIESPKSMDIDINITNSLYSKLLLHPQNSTKSPTPIHSACDPSIDSPSILSSSNSDIITNSDIISSLSSTSNSFFHRNNNNNNINNKFDFPLYFDNKQQQNQHQQLKECQQSPFQECIDKLWEMSHCHTPTKKLQCLVELQQLIIKSIDKYRQKQQYDDDDDDDDDDEEEEEEEEKKEEKEKEKQKQVNYDDNDDDGMSIESLDYVSDDDDFDENIIENTKKRNNVNNKKTKRRTHGIIIGDDDDDEDEEDVNVSLISYESATSEYWTQSLQQQQQQSKPSIDIKKVDNKNKKNKKQCKQLLIASDDMIPLFCYILVQSQIQSVSAEIAFMNDFMSDEEKQMKSGFYLTTLQAATSALLEKKLPIP